MTCCVLHDQNFTQGTWDWPEFCCWSHCDHSLCILCAICIKCNYNSWSHWIQWHEVSAETMNPGDHYGLTDSCPSSLFFHQIPWASVLNVEHIKFHNINIFNYFKITQIQFCNLVHWKSKYSASLNLLDLYFNAQFHHSWNCVHHFEGKIRHSFKTETERDW